MCPFILGNLENKLEEFVVSLIKNIQNQKLQDVTNYLQLKSDNTFVGTFPHIYENLNQVDDSFKNINQQNLNFEKYNGRFRKPK